MRLTSSTSMTLALTAGLLLAIGCSSSDDKNGGTAGAGGSAAGTSSAGTAGTNSAGTGTAAGTNSGGTSAAGTSSGGTSAAGTSSGGSAGTGSGTKAQWVKIPLLDETVDGTTYMHSTDDWVNGLWFDSTGAGFIGTYFGGGEDWGGTLTTIAGDKAQKIVASGGHQWIDPDLNVHFRTVHKVKDGWAVQTDRIGLVYLSTDGQTFARTQPGTGFESLPNAGYGWFEDTSGGWWTGDNLGHLYHATTKPAPQTPWTEVTPAEADCSPPQTDQTGSPGYQWRRLFAGDDGQTVIYPLGDKPGVCVSSDGAKTWKTVLFPSPPTGADPAFGMVFSSNKNGFVYARESIAPGSTYGYTTSDGGLTWTASTLPKASDSNENYFRDVAFAPSGQVGYIVGGKNGSSSDAPPLLYKTTDGGKTWTDITTASFTGSVVDVGGDSVFATVFAPDDGNVWIGGHDGLLIHHTKGGFND